MSAYFLTIIDIIIRYVRNNIQNEKYNLILWFPVFQCAGILIYFSLNSEPSFIFTVSTFLLLVLTLILIAILCKKHSMNLVLSKCSDAGMKNDYSMTIGVLCIAVIAVLIGFTASKLRTTLVDTHILSKERYVKDIIATVKDINDKGKYKNFCFMK